LPPRRGIKRALLAPLRIPGVAEILSHLTATPASIFMLHRFTSLEDGLRGHDPAMVREVLSRLRRQHYNLMSLRELFRRLREGEVLTRAVAFTIDDGYFEHGSVAGPIFAEFDCPVTIFVVSGFMDGNVWLWWDQIQYICETTARSELRVALGNEQRLFRLDSLPSRLAAANDISVWCQDASQANRVACIARMSQEADVEVPAVPPRQFAPLSWDDARRLEKLGVRFGPHSVTHPVLSSTSDDDAEFEISSSWKRLCDELASPVPIFGYPHGRLRDFGPREIENLQRIGLWGAVAGCQGSFRLEKCRTAPGIYSVPRFPFSDDVLNILQCVSGLEDVKARLRGGGA
jgi:peptidoglycan/xylan/chitin deacetylase (PgdA/CDA1 family)